MTMTRQWETLSLWLILSHSQWLVRLPMCTCLRQKCPRKSISMGIIEVDNEEHNDFIKSERKLLIRKQLRGVERHHSGCIVRALQNAKVGFHGHRTGQHRLQGIWPVDQARRGAHCMRPSWPRWKLKWRRSSSKRLEKEKKLQRSEADLFARHKEMKEKLTKQIKLLEEKKAQLEKQRACHWIHRPLRHEDA